MSKHTPTPWFFRNADRPYPGMAPCRYVIENTRAQWNKDLPNSDGTMGDWDRVDAIHYESIAITTCGTAMHTSFDNASFIVRAVNSHDALLAACEAMLALHADDGTRSDVPEWNAARSAIAAAKGGGE